MACAEMLTEMLKAVAEKWKATRRTNPVEHFSGAEQGIAVCGIRVLS